MPKLSKEVKLPLIHVKWVDSCHFGGDWTSLQNFAKEYRKEELMQETAGFLLRETEYSYLIVQSKGLCWSRPNEDFAIDAIMEIPKVAVTEINYLTKKKNAKVHEVRKTDSSRGRGGQTKKRVSEKR